MQSLKREMLCLDRIPIELIKKIGSALFGPAIKNESGRGPSEEELEEAVPESVQEIPTRNLSLKRIMKVKGDSLGTSY